MGSDGDPARCEVIDASADRPAIEGILRRKGLHDELRGDAYAVVETPRGKAAYVCLDAASADALVEGSVVRITVEPQRWAKPVDRVLDRVAWENGGVYYPRVHLDALRLRPIVIAGRTIQPEEVVAANVRRLARLERHRLVTRTGEGRWRVPVDLVSSLEARDASHPRRLLGLGGCSTTVIVRDRFVRGVSFPGLLFLKPHTDIDRPFSRSFTAPRRSIKTRRIG